MRNNPAGAIKAFEEALPSMLEAGNFLGAVADIFYQARLAFYMGDADYAESFCEQWKKKFAELAIAGMNGTPAPPEIPATRGLDIVESLIFLERGKFDEAENLLIHSLETQGWGSWMELHGFVELAQMRFRRGNVSGANEILLRMAKLGTQHAACAEGLQILFDLKKSPEDVQTRTKAEGWGRTHFLKTDGPFALGIGPYHRDAEYFCNLTWARVQIMLGNADNAAIFIEPALESAREHDLAFRVAELSIAKALIDDITGNSSTAMQALETALDIGERYGFVRFFEDGPELDRLLAHASEKNIHARFINQTLATFRRQIEGRKGHRSSPSKCA